MYLWEDCKVKTNPSTRIPIGIRRVWDKSKESNEDGRKALEVTVVKYTTSSKTSIERRSSLIQSCKIWRINCAHWASPLKSKTKFCHHLLLLTVIKLLGMINVTQVLTKTIDRLKAGQKFMNSWAKLIKTLALVTQPKIETKPPIIAQPKLHQLFIKMLGEAKRQKTHTHQKEFPVEAHLEWCRRAEIHTDEKRNTKKCCSLKADGVSDLSKLFNLMLITALPN